MVTILNKNEDYSYLPMDVRNKIANAENIDFIYPMYILALSSKQHCDFSYPENVTL
jgi:hypothetical protein